MRVVCFQEEAHASLNAIAEAKRFHDQESETDKSMLPDYSSIPRCSMKHFGILMHPVVLKSSPHYFQDFRSCATIMADRASARGSKVIVLFKVLHNIMK